MSELPIARWTEVARRDDWHMEFVGSDIRQMLGRITQLEADVAELLALAERIDAMWSEFGGHPDNARTPKVREVWKDLRQTLARIQGDASGSGGVS